MQYLHCVKILCSADYARIAHSARRHDLVWNLVQPTQAYLRDVSK